MVSIITINYNGWQDTCELIDSLKRYETYPYEVIVVDNASKGDDVQRLRNAFPDIQVVASDRNLGFAGGNNLGYRYASGNYILFLNNDMLIKSSFLAPLVHSLQKGDYAGVSPCIHFLYKPGQIQYYGYHDMTRITLRHTTELFDPARRENFLRPVPTEVLHGGAMMFRREAIEKVGLMAETYFLFYEEFDWSRRFREAGYKLFYEPSSNVYHKESMTIKSKTPLRNYYLTRSRIIFARRNNKGVSCFLSCLYLVVISAPYKMLNYVGKGNWNMISSIWKGTFAGLFAKIY